MSKCGKGCLPECEYFTTGGCISPFNCAYKIEEHYQNTVFTSGDINALSGIEKFFINTVKSGVLPQEPMNYDGAAMKAYISYLESENASLRRQISEMIMPPCTLGDTLYITSFCFGDGCDEVENAVHTSGWQISETKVDEKNFYKMCDLVRNGIAFFSREAAEKELEELVGKCKCEFGRKSKFDREFERGVRRGEELFRKANGREGK